jgi:hypothetical protein
MMGCLYSMQKHGGIKLSVPCSGVHNGLRFEDDVKEWAFFLFGLPNIILPIYFPCGCVQFICYWNVITMRYIL